MLAEKFGLKKQSLRSTMFYVPFSKILSGLKITQSKLFAHISHLSGSIDLYHFTTFT